MTELLERQIKGITLEYQQVNLEVTSLPPLLPSLGPERRSLLRSFADAPDPCYFAHALANPPCRLRVQHGLN